MDESINIQIYQKWTYIEIKWTYVLKHKVDTQTSNMVNTKPFQQSKWFQLKSHPLTVCMRLTLFRLGKGDDGGRYKFFCVILMLFYFYAMVNLVTFLKKKKKETSTVTFCNLMFLWQPRFQRVFYRNLVLLI